MGIYIYALVLIAFGIFISYKFGKATKEKSGCIMVVVFGIVSVLIGFFLSMGGAQLAEVLCKLGPNFCIATDDHTVWALLYPIILFPLYLIAMYVPKET